MAWPGIFQEPRERTIRENSPFGLTSRTVIRFLVGVTYALNRCPTYGAGFPKPPMHCHFRTKNRDFFRKAVSRFGSKPIGPFEQHTMTGRKQPGVLIIEFPRKKKWGKMGAMKNFIRVGVSDTAEQMRIDERTVKGMVAMS